ncbi:MAG: DNA recombination protein RmuC [Candidatus Spechtbacterales bacterium]
MITGIIIGLILLGALIGAVYFIFIRRKVEKYDSLEKNFENFAANLMEEKIKNFMNIASMSFKEREEKVHRIFEQIQRELREHRQYADSLDKERIKTYSELKHGITSQAELTERLRTSTDKLNNILSNSRLRGQFGERVAEDILKAGGLIEGTHYVKNKAQETVSTRPDFSFLLPDSHRINMDVKFPLDNFSRMIEVEGEEDQNFKKAFLRDIKEKIKEVTTREYINPNENTLDFVILFIPNERIASYIHENFPEIFDMAVSSKVILTSPYNLISFVSMVQRAFQNFYQKEHIRDILLLIGEFSGRYDLFKKRFQEIGKSIDKSKNAYEDIAEKSFKMLDSTIGKIDKHQKGLPADKVGSPAERLE